ncbi:MAG TPA: 3-methyl-2-oxobutanoate hydroxymethyltransferase [Candidatus Wallbacteria bacterium]|nr:3-methyl-2-oxobutanoate hydroxymethyltransferase [Candidatus Wallbacteria bacterium]
MNVNDFAKYKLKKRKISMITCYDHYSAKIIAATDIDCILVGDSAAMVMHGYDSTIGATSDMMATHVMAVSKGAPDKFIISDMPFLAVRKDKAHAMKCVGALIRAGANAVKIEGVSGHEKIISHIIGSGIPVMGHLGLTPQSVNGLGGYKVQGGSDAARDAIMRDAEKLEKLGAFLIVLECVPAVLAGDISKNLNIPVIGIGAGPKTDGQVLVLQDMLGLTGEFKPKFLRKYLDGSAIFKAAIENYHKDVVSGSFPDESESYE